MVVGSKHWAYLVENATAAHLSLSIMDRRLPWGVSREMVLVVPSTTGSYLGEVSWIFKNFLQNHEDRLFRDDEL
jgi:hypothetical protein